jgi:hypothetical protein
MFPFWLICRTKDWRCEKAAKGQATAAEEKRHRRHASGCDSNAHFDKTHNQDGEDVVAEIRFVLIQNLLEVDAQR